MSHATTPASLRTRCSIASRYVLSCAPLVFQCNSHGTNGVGYRRIKAAAPITRTAATLAATTTITITVETAAIAAPIPVTAALPIAAAAIAVAVEPAATTLVTAFAESTDIHADDAGDDINPLLGRLLERADRAGRLRLRSRLRDHLGAA